MPPRISRRAVAVEQDAPTPTQTQRRRQAETPDEDGDVDMEESQKSGSGSLEQLSKSLVRYALSCEFARKPIKRQDVNEKVLGSHARLFKSVFAQANSELMDVFGMTMAELPKGEKVTTRQKRAAAGSESQSKASNMWVLQTILPEQYRMPEVIGPSRGLAKSEDDRPAAYVGLYTMVIALVTIAGGRLPEGKLDRALKRMNAEQTTPIDTTDKTLALMIKDGYIVKVRDTAAGEETTDYIVGPRGKVEVGREGFAELIRTIYGNSEEDAEELEQKIKRTLDVAGATSGVAPAGDAPAPQAAGRKRGRPRGEDDEDDE
ncbi:MAGE-domain-containing protein [Macroventuria anomochaeta]|uniref:MAGE-domain-containing protein n=1 Tax=Macroventuria anomochaeta TaxID=301207 RepID=A0ACB6RJE0_9PLEO|nr:MAGE-domain-containing protein [Macroventuria anomochaeta]KAF2621218.1 MAGE-domain-containing protein [Macroventuria anomochaeta]